MISIDYYSWKKAVLLVEKYVNTYGKNYLQLYALNKYDFGFVSDKNYFDKYIVNGAFLNNEDNYNTFENYKRKQDGTYRKRYLLSPIMYIYYVAIGIYISGKYKKHTRDKLSIKYAGDFKNNDLHYKNSYQDFSNETLEKAKSYNYYLKFDIENFFTNIDLNILTAKISNHMKFGEKDKLLLKTFLLWVGNGKFPQTECGITSSYLASVIYLDGLENKLIKYLKNNEIIEDFYITRYVDDTYIFLKLDGRKNKSIIENDLTAVYSNELYKLNLSINYNKTTFKKTYLISEDIKSRSLVDEYFSSDEIIDLDLKENIILFLNKVCGDVNKNGINYNAYYNAIDECFSGYEFQPIEIYNSISYKKLDFLQSNRVCAKLKNIIDLNFSILGIDPERLVSILLATKNENLIKRFLYNLIKSSENHEWNNDCNYLAVRYLLSRNFRHTKLITILEKNNESIYKYINQFILNDWTNNIISSSNAIMIEKLNIDVKDTIYFNKYMQIIANENKNLLEVQMYNKNYFDAFSSLLAKTKNIPHSSSTHFQKRELKEIYSTIGLSRSNRKKIDSICDDRNANPLSHVGGTLLSKKNMKKVVTGNVESVNSIIEETLTII